MEIERKAVGVAGLKVMGDAEDGLIRAIVSVTGLRDNVNDIINPGAYEKSLKARTPKGVWHHNWQESVSRTEAIEELLPGHKDLPKSLPNGQPWPTEAGALMVDTRFNLKTQRGREAYEDVKFFGDQQEWSIGYNVPVGGAKVDSKTGIRSIDTLDLYEYSPVLFGAMPAARTGSVKEAQSSYAEIKSLHGDEAGAFLMEIKSLMGDESFVPELPEVKAAPKDEDPGDHDEDHDEDERWEDDDEDDDIEGKAMAFAASPEKIRNAIEALQALLSDSPDEDTQEEKGGWDGFEVKELADMVESAGYDHLVKSAQDFDTAVESGDVEAMEKSAAPILDFVEAMDDFDEGADQVKEFAGYIAEQFTDVESGEEDDDEDVADDAEDLDDPEGDNTPSEEAGSGDEAKSLRDKMESKSIDLADIQAALADI